MKRFLAPYLSATVILLGSGAAAFANEPVPSARPAPGAIGAQGGPLLRMRLADNVVVAPAPQPTSGAVTTATTPAPATNTTVMETPRSNKVVHVDTAQPHNYMTTIALSALMGGVAGGLVGGAIYFLGNQTNAQRIGYWAAGGVLVGAGVGLVQIVTQESRASEATALRKLPSDPAPTLRLALLQTRF